MAGLTHASPSVEAAPVAASGKRRFSPGRDALRRFLRHRMAAASILVLALLALSIVLGPLLWRIPINEIDFTARLAPPSWEHPFGTDDLGQDLLARMIYGGRISLAVGFAAMGVALIVGIVVGALAGNTVVLYFAGATIILSAIFTLATAARSLMAPTQEQAG